MNNINRRSIKLVKAINSIYYAIFFQESNRTKSHAETNSKQSCMKLVDNFFISRETKLNQAGSIRPNYQIHFLQATTSR